MTITIPLKAILGGLFLIAISGWIVVGLMLWKPWDNPLSVPDKIAACDSLFSAPDTPSSLRTLCIKHAVNNDAKWGCFIEYPSEPAARSECVLLHQ